eukprot:3099061-Rhodomonas_salina.2
MSGADASITSIRLQWQLRGQQWRAATGRRFPGIRLQTFCAMYGPDVASGGPRLSCSHSCAAWWKATTPHLDFAFAIGNLRC